MSFSKVWWFNAALQNCQGYTQVVRSRQYHGTEFVRLGVRRRPTRPGYPPIQRQFQTSSTIWQIIIWVKLWLCEHAPSNWWTFTLSAWRIWVWQIRSKQWLLIKIYGRAPGCGGIINHTRSDSTSLLRVYMTTAWCINLFVLCTERFEFPRLNVLLLHHTIRRRTSSKTISRICPN